MKYFFIANFTFWLTFLHFQSCKTETLESKNTSDFILQKEFKTILTEFAEGLNPADSTSVFVVINNVDAITAKIYVVAKKPLRSDFGSIGLPFHTSNIHKTPFYFFTGIEKFLDQDTLFWKKHPEIFDDRKKQASGIFEPPIIKKALYTFSKGSWHKASNFDVLSFFIGKPRDTLRFGND